MLWSFYMGILLFEIGKKRKKIQWEQCSMCVCLRCDEKSRSVAHESIGKCLMLAMVKMVCSHFCIHETAIVDFHRQWRGETETAIYFSNIQIGFAFQPSLLMAISVRMCRPAYRVNQFNGAETIWFEKCQFYCTMARKTVNLLVDM